MKNKLLANELAQQQRCCRCERETRSPSLQSASPATRSGLLGRGILSFFKFQSFQVTTFHPSVWNRSSPKQNPTHSLGCVLKSETSGQLMSI